MGAPQRGQATVEWIGLVLLLALAFAAAIVAMPRPHSGLAALVDHYAASDLDRFLAYRESVRHDTRLDFSTDGCSAPIVGSSGASFDFTAACLRHDFGYRNYGRLGLFGERRRAVDDRFLADMLDSCERARAGWELTRCRAWAETFFLGVRAFGWAAGPRP